jgi:large subunit ribosomal protein L9
LDLSWCWPSRWPSRSSWGLAIHGAISAPALKRAGLDRFDNPEFLMEVILRNAVDKLGHPGDIVSVSPGFARNYLIPRGFAFEATEGNRKRIALEKSRLEALENERVAAAQAIADKLGEVSVTFAARVGEEGKLFGSVTTADIAHQLELQGFKIEKRQVELNEPIKALGMYKVGVRLHADVKPEIKVWVIKQ